MTQAITREEIARALEGGEAVTLVEALPEKYYAEGHLPGALQINHDEVAARAPKLLPDRDAKIVVYCASESCQNSAMAAAALSRLGYSRVFEYERGKEDWRDAGLPLET